MSTTQSLTVLVIGASPDAVNQNAKLRGYVKRGFGAILPDHCVKEVSFEYSVEAITEGRPGLVLVFGSVMPDVCDYARIKNAAQTVGAHLAFWLHDDPYEFDYNFKAVEVADTIFTNDLWAAEHYYCFPRVFHLPMAACLEAHYRDMTRHSAKRTDIFFAGVAFENRLKFMHDLRPALREYRTRILGSGWPSDLPGSQNTLVPNEVLADYYARSWVVLNLGRDFNLANERYRLAATTPGPRTFEAAMAGCVQLYFVTGLEIEDYFIPDTEILLFDHASEVPDIVGSILSDPDRALSIARAAQRRAVKDHSYSARAKTILGICFPEWQPASEPSTRSALA